MKCQVCQQETNLPFHCPFCGGQFCSAHRLPENHACPRLDFARAQRQAQVMTPQSYNSYQYSYNYGQQPRRNHISTSPTEIKHITVAAALIIAIGFSIGLYGKYFGGFSFTWTWGLMAAFAVIMTASVLTHEMAHKILAQQRGLWAEFRLVTWGVVLTFISIFLPFRMIAPGAMMISGSASSDDIVKISVAGPVTNIILSAGILGVAFALLPSTFALMLFFVAYINAFLSVFNLLPFGILDGFKVFSFSKKLWVLAFIPSIILTIFTFILIGL
jgi:Zn-dependent protease